MGTLKKFKFLMYLGKVCFCLQIQGVTGPVVAGSHALSLPDRLLLHVWA